MERETAIMKFWEETAGEIQEYRIQMGQHLLERAEQLEGMVKQAVGELGKRMEQQQKEYVSFLYFSLLKSDLASHNYQFLLHAMNHQWYLDEESLEVYIPAGDLFEPLEAVWDYLTEESRPYIGAINQYDIQAMIFDELKIIDGAISQILRYRLRDWEKKGIFASVTLAPYWLLKWGEYRDQTEFIIQTDRVVKEKHIWREEIRKAVHKPETLVFSYWYQGEYRESRLDKLDMKFIVFEESELHNLQFTECNMEGSRFTDNRLSGCCFENCNLWGADFSGCTFEQVSFAGSELTGAVFPAESVPFLNLGPEQLQVVLLKREES